MNPQSLTEIQTWAGTSESVTLMGKQRSDNRAAQVLGDRMHKQDV